MTDLTPEQRAKCREVFELHVAKRCGAYGQVVPHTAISKLDKTQLGTYHSRTIQEQWELWQAAYSAAQPRSAEQVEEVPHISAKWRDIKPSCEAQRIRSALLFELDSTDFMPSYVVEVVDIAIQLAMNSTHQSPGSGSAAQAGRVDEKQLGDLASDLIVAVLTGARYPNVKEYIAAKLRPYLIPTPPSPSAEAGNEKVY